MAFFSACNLRTVELPPFPFQGNFSRVETKRSEGDRTENEPQSKSASAITTSSAQHGNRRACPLSIGKGLHC